MKIINLTPHIINVCCGGKTVATYEPSGTVARIDTTLINFGNFRGLNYNLYTQKVGGIVNLPEMGVETIYYIVSTMVRTSCPDRLDLLSPATLVRNEQGQPIGCEGLVSN